MSGRTHKREDQRIRSAWRAKFLHPIFLTLFLGFFVATFGLVYLAQANSLATSGLEIKDLEKNLVALKESNKKLELRALELQSMFDIEKIGQEQMEMVKVSAINHVTSGGSVVAVNR